MTQGIVTAVSRMRASRPSASSLMTPMHSPNVASDEGLPPVKRTAESPRPMPQIVRGPNMSLSVAKSEAVTDQSRVRGLVTIGPTLMREVELRIWE